MNVNSPKAEDQAKVLDESLSIVKVQSFHMKRCLDNFKLMDALKHCSTMLSELRTSSLTPKTYYELYMAIFDELRFLTTYLYDAHISNKHHLSDLYELVQYAGNIVPRLYLMITVGSVYMRVSKESIGSKNSKAVSNPNRHGLQSYDKNDEKNIQSSPEKASDMLKDENDDEVPPIKELMRDMLEMSRGVQHPTRGLFLRYYLSGMTRDYLPDGVIDGPHGTINDSIHFILQNFIEMNKLWVRLQHQGHSREKFRREQERKELRLLVGSNLVRLSQLESLDLAVYQNLVLPSILEEIVNCKDVIAQDYLMEVIIQVFPDDFHLKTLDPFLSATAQLQRNVNIKQIVISLIDRFSNFALRAREEQRLKLKNENEKLNTIEDDKSPITLKNISNGGEGSPSSTAGGIPNDVQLFDVFWHQITELVKARPEFSIQYIIALLGSLINLSLNCYPEHLEYVDNVLLFAKQKFLEAKNSNSPDINSAETRISLSHLLLSPINVYKGDTISSFLNFPSSSTKRTESSTLAGNYTDLLFLQPYSLRREVSHALCSALLTSSASGFRISSIDGINLLFGELLSCLIREQNDGGLFGQKITDISSLQKESGPKYEPKVISNDSNLDWGEVVQEQEMIARLVHLIESFDENGIVAEKELDQDFMLLSAARKHFSEGGDVRIRFTLPPLIIASIKLARKYGSLRQDSLVSEDDSSITPKLQALYKFIHQTITALLKARENFELEEDNNTTSLFGETNENFNKAVSGVNKIGSDLMSPPEISLRMFLLAAQSANETGFEELSYEFFVQAFTIYEESISESKSQNAAITLIIGTMQNTFCFGYENYLTLITKCLVHSSRLLKRVDQCRGQILVSHLYWCEDEINSNNKITNTGSRPENKPGYKDGKKVLECLQKSLKIADSMMDRLVSVELFIEVLERCVWFFENKNEFITMKYINSLIELIETNLAAMPVTSPTTTTSSSNNATLGGVQHHTGLDFNSIGPLNSTSSFNFENSVNNNNISDSIRKYFKNVVRSIEIKKEEDIKNGVGGFSRWADFEGI
ncbi:Vacuolar protein sorting-associated protein 35 [Lobulomyces angularis]|nr:Vacuolar protein sorting-associated protein 35 [Lobulomyces angularis]